MQLLNKAVGSHWRLFLSKFWFCIKQPSKDNFNISILYFKKFFIVLLNNIRSQYYLIRCHNKIYDELHDIRSFMEKIDILSSEENNHNVNDIIDDNSFYIINKSHSQKISKTYV